MNEKDLCRFCDIKSGNVTLLEDKPIIENENYFSIASIGALVDGWVLIIPKEHTCSMKTFYEKEGFIDFVNRILIKLWTHYNSPIIAFEHGSNKIGSLTSCGTDHAHLHLVPYNQSLLHRMFKTKLYWEQCYSSQIVSAIGDNEYFFYTEFPMRSYWTDPFGYLHILEKPISQFFRRLIAQELNCIERYDYRKYPNRDNVILTQQILSGSR